MRFRLFMAAWIMLMGVSCAPRTKKPVAATPPAAVDKPPPDRTKQIDIAKSIYVKFDGRYAQRDWVDTMTPVFVIESAQRLDNLASLPDLPIEFALELPSEKGEEPLLSDEKLQEIDHLLHLVGLSLDVTPLTEAGIRTLQELKPLNKLVARYNATATNDQLTALQSFAKPLRVNLEQSKITDAGLQSLQSVSQLQELRLSPAITDQGLKILAKFPSLTRLEVGRAKLSEQAIEQLQAQRPACQIVR